MTGEETQPPDVKAPAGPHHRPSRFPAKNLSPIERHGAALLFVAGVSAWVLAAGFVEHDAAAAAWVVAGFVLIAAAAFFQRVTKIGREGIEIRELFEEAAEKAESDPRALDDTSDERARRVVEYAAPELEELVRKEWRRDRDQLRDYVRRMGTDRPKQMEGDRVENNLTAAVFNWLSGKDYSITLEDSDGVRTDLVARREEQTLLIEIRPAVDTLRYPDAMAIVARQRATHAPGEHRVVVFREGVWMDQETRDLLEGYGISIWAADPDSGAVRVITTGAIEGIE